MEQLTCHWTDGSLQDLIFEDFSKIFYKNSSFVQSNRNYGTLHENLCIFTISRSLLRMRSASDKSCRKKSKHILYSVIFLGGGGGSFLLWDIVGLQ